MTGPLEKVLIFCHTCEGDGWVIEREYEEGKTPEQAIPIKVVCPECNGLGSIQALKFLNPPQLRVSTRSEKVE